MDNKEKLLGLEAWGIERLRERLSEAAGSTMGGCLNCGYDAPLHWRRCIDQPSVRW
jgi:hypothetical protein